VSDDTQDVITADTVLECEWCGSPCVGAVLCGPCVAEMIVGPRLAKPDGTPASRDE
jgi:hypothetical protein